MKEALDDNRKRIAAFLLPMIAILTICVIWGQSPFALMCSGYAAEGRAEVWIVTLIKTGSCGLAMYLFLDRKRTSMDMLVFSTAYALLAYAAACRIDPMWIDAMSAFPLLIWEIGFLAESGRYLFYTVMIVLTVVTNGVVFLGAV